MSESLDYIDHESDERTTATFKHGAVFIENETGGIFLSANAARWLMNAALPTIVPAIPLSVTPPDPGPPLPIGDAFHVRPPW